MRKEDPYLLEVWVQEDHLNGERVSLQIEGWDIWSFFLEDALKPVILVKQK